MPSLRTAALAILLGSGAATAAPEVEGTRVAFAEGEIREIVVTLDAWLDASSDMPRAETELARISLVPAGAEVAYEGSMTRIDESVRGLYDEASATIYLVRPWFGDTAEDRSVLLHEMVHHRQVGAKHWYCPEAMEWDAYKLQEAYLAEHGETLEVNWAWVVLVSSCAPRDHHPD